MHGGGPVGRAELVVEPEHVVLDRARGEEERGADLGVGEPVADEPQDLALARREAHVAGGGGLGLAGAAAGELVHGAQQLAGGRVLGDRAAGAGGAGDAHRHVVPPRGEQRGRRAGGAQALAHGQAEADVDQREVERTGWPAPRRGCRADAALDPRNARQQPAQAAAQHLIIFDHQDSQAPRRGDARNQRSRFGTLRDQHLTLLKSSLTAPFLTRLAACSQATSRGDLSTASVTLSTSMALSSRPRSSLQVAFVGAHGELDPVARRRSSRGRARARRWQIPSTRSSTPGRSWTSTDSRVTEEGATPGGRSSMVGTFLVPRVRAQAHPPTSLRTTEARGGVPRA